MTERVAAPTETLVTFAVAVLCEVARTVTAAPGAVMDALESTEASVSASAVMIASALVPAPANKPRLIATGLVTTLFVLVASRRTSSGPPLTTAPNSVFVPPATVELRQVERQGDETAGEAVRVTLRRVLAGRGDDAGCPRW